VRIFGDTVGVAPGRLVEVACAAELIHSASLLHDDVVDAGMFRRGRPTVNARWGNIVAVMSGDLLLSGALLRLAEVDPRLNRSALEVIAEMTRAAIAEVEARGNLELPLAQLRRIAEGKTGALFGWCGVAAATVGEETEAARCFDAFGRRLGVAFQIADDVRDLTGTDEGKPQYADLQSKTLSLPVLLAVGRDPRLRARLAEAWGFPTVGAERARELGTAVLCSGALDAAVEAMELELDDAATALGPYARAPGGAQLLGWARTVARGLALKTAA
jgi:geranylgeranyl pyrophosphate synthase